MTLDKSDAMMMKRSIVKDQLEKEGWIILYENKNPDDPMDIGATRSKGIEDETIVIHVLRDTDVDAGGNELNDLRSALKEKAEMINGVPFFVEVSQEEDGSLKDLVYSQII